MAFTFNTAFLKDYTVEDLEASENPFSLILLAHKLLINTENDNEKRYHLKNKIIELAVSRNYTKKQIDAALTFSELYLNTRNGTQIQEKISGIYQKYHLANHETLNFC